jgi:hypothetical protein
VDYCHNDGESIFGRETFAVAENLIQAPAIGSITIEPVQS